MSPAPLAAGGRLGPYEITAKLGEGGMGEVWRATDPRLRREVALKVLPQAFVADPERLARFEREAQLLAQLQHPNIAAIHGLEESDGTRALVMELVEGEDLAARIARGPLPLDEALPIARQIVEALEVAHERGIVHRDLKPANVKVRPDGVVKVLDFGLAKAMDLTSGTSATNLAASPTLLNSPTLTAAHGTQLGMILGTAAYMSPEQARGSAVDKRADIWAFGVVLYETLTGRPLFAGDTVSDTLAGVLKSEVDFGQLPAATPPALRQLLRRCLERNPKNRLHDIADARLVLDEIAAGSAEATPPPAPGRRSPLGRQPVLWAAAALLLAAGIGIGKWLGGPLAGGTKREPPTAPLRFVVPAPAGVEGVENPELSRDGSLLVFEGLSERGGRLFVHRFATGETSELPELEAPSTFALSPDGRWIAYASGGKMFKRALAGGEPLTFCASCEIASGATWLENGSILFNRAWLDGLSIVAEQGEPRRLTTPDARQGEKGHWFPRPLPGGTHALFTIFTAGGGINDSWIALLDLSSGDYRRLLPGADAQYQSPGQLLFYRAGAYHAVGFDLSTLAPSGTPVRVLDGVQELEPQGTERRQVSAGATGALAYLPGSIAEPSRLGWVAAGSEPELLPFETRAYRMLALAPNGRDVVATTLESGALVLHRLDLESASDERLPLPGSNWAPSFRPDGAAIAYTTLRKGDFDVYLMPLFGTGAERPLLTGLNDEFVHGWSPDGVDLIAEISRPDGSYPLFAVPLAGGEKRLLVDRPFEPNEADVSPDGRWLLFRTTHTGRRELYIQPVDRSGGALRATRQGGTQPRWSPDGRAILFRNRDAIFTADFRVVAGRPEVGVERQLVAGPFVDVDAPLATNDGRRFLVPLRAASRPPAAIAIVIGWNHEVAARLESER